MNKFLEDLKPAKKKSALWGLGMWDYPWRLVLLSTLRW